MTLEVILTAFALMLILEGLGPLLFPNRWRSFMLSLAKEKISSIRQIGVALVVIGSLLLLFQT